LTSIGRAVYHRAVFCPRFAASCHAISRAVNAGPSPPEQRPSFSTRLNRLLRTAMVTAALLAALAAAAYFYARHRADEEIRAFCEAQFQQHYAPSGLTVSLGYARLAEGQGIELRDLKILDPSADAPQTELVHIDQIFVYAKVQLQDLLAGPPAAEHVAIHRLRLRAARQIDGTWNTARLLPLPHCDGPAPTVTIDDAVVRIADAHSGRTTSLNLREINLFASPEQGDPTGLRVEGTLAGDHFQKLRLNGVVNTAKGTWTLGGLVSELELSAELYEKLPRELGRHVKALAGLKGQATLQFDLRRTAAGAPVQFAVKGELTGAHLTDPRLPYPLTDIVAQVYADNQRLEVTDMRARCGAGRLQLSARQEGLQSGSPISLNLWAWQLPLEDRLAEILPQDMQETWRTFDPAGPVDLQLQLTFDGRNWTSEVTLDCHGTSFVYSEFPYRINNCVGRLRMVDDVLTVDVTGAAAGRPIHFDATFHHPGDHFTGGGVIVLDGAVPIDEEFLASLDPPTQQVVRSMQPRGMITFTGRFRRDDPRQQELDLDCDIGLRDCAIRYENFPYPIEHVNGLLKCRNKSWEFRDLEGRNDNGYIVCDGSWEPGDVGGLLNLHFVGADILLEDELRAALGQEAQKIWNDLRPRGTVDHLNIELEFDSATRRLALDVTGQKWKNKENKRGRSIVIEPVWFPYRLEDVSGAIHFRDGEVQLTNLSGRHGKTTVSLSGVSTFKPDGTWRASIQQLAGDRIECDHELMSALPGRLGDAVKRLHLSGPINLLGSVELWGRRDAGSVPSAKWDLSFDMENGSLDAGLHLEHIRGGVRLQGSHDAAGFLSRGTLAVDSVIYNQVHFTQLRGPLWIDQSRVLFGSWSNQASGGTAQQVKAKVFGGDFYGDAQVALEGDGEFILQVALTDGELAQLSQELTSRRDSLSGKASATVELYGNARGTHTWRGSGMVRLRSADIYELPVMLGLLKVLRMQRPDKTAFNSSDIDFRIQGDHFYFDRINFTGDAVTLKGSGWMDLDKQIDIDFYTLVGKDRIRIPIVTPALGLMSRELLLIHAGGTLDAPELSRKTLPGLNDRLKQLFPEVERTASPTTHETRPWPDGPFGGIFRR
jgi:hypothetical protein